MITLKLCSGRVTSEMSVSGSPSTSSRSARAPSSTTPTLPGYGLRLPLSCSSSPLVPVAMTSASPGVYHCVRLARIAPCCEASAAENSTSVSHAVLSRCFFASS